MFLQEMLSFILVILCLFMLCKVYKNVLMLLMCMEFLVLSVLNSLFTNLMFMEMEFIYLVFMIFFVIEGVLGLSLLINLIHFKGNDNIKNLSMMMW